MFLKTVVMLTATLGVGRIPKAPGTFGSLLALLVWWAILPLSLNLQVLLILIAIFVGWISTYYYEKWNHSHDPKEVVIDELIGMWITLLAAAQSVPVFLLGFLFFRLFDIWKPFPIGWVDRKLTGAFSTLFDDILAAVYAFLLLNLTLYLGSSFGFVNH